MGLSGGRDSVSPLHFSRQPIKKAIPEAEPSAPAGTPLFVPLSAAFGDRLKLLVLDPKNQHPTSPMLVDAFLWQRADIKIDFFSIYFFSP